MDQATREKTDREITERAKLASRLREMYFPQVPWNKCYREMVPNLINLLEEKARPFYQNQPDDRISYLKFLNNISDEDIHLLLD